MKNKLKFGMAKNRVKYGMYVNKFAMAMKGKKLPWQKIIILSWKVE